MEVRLEQLYVRHPAAKPGAEPAIKALSFSLAAGEHLAVIGPSGAGKTTLLQALACALKPQAGSLYLAGRDPWSLSSGPLRKLRGQLFLAAQTPPLPPRQRVVTAVLAGRLPAMSLAQSLRNLFYPTAIGLAHEALSRFDLAEKLFDRVDRLSGGERQRVGLARALVAPASLLLIDEPLSALDPTRADQAIRALTAAARERGATLVTSLHHVEVARAHFPRIIGLREGALAFDLPAAEVSSTQLATLYAQKEHELWAPVGASEEIPATAAPPAVMICR
jgi:ABC-type phosphate/phosphonate transport system, ATPase component